MKSKILVVMICLFVLGLAGCNTDKHVHETESTEGQNSEMGDYIQSDLKIEYRSDLTHDGREENIVLTIEPSETKDIKVEIAVYDPSNVIYKNEMYVHSNLGQCMYLVNYNGNDYLMIYDSKYNHDAVSCYYAVFSFNEAGEMKVLDSDEIYHSLWDINTFDKNAWLEFAEKVNQYFTNAFLIVNTQNSSIQFSEPDSKITYKENFAWFPYVNESGTTEVNVEQFVNSAKIIYANDELSLMQKVLFNKADYNDGKMIANVEGIYNDEYDRGVTFFVVDFDSDGKDEVCITYGSGDILILHEADGQIYGYNHTFRGFNPVYTDGTFGGSSGASNSEFYGKVSFTKDEFRYEDITGVEWDRDGNATYYKNGTSYTGVKTSKEEYDQIMSQYEMTEVEVYEFTVENILKYVK